MINIQGIVDTVAISRKNESILDLLLEFEGILDNLHVYAYENWLEGEIIKGPIVERFWITIYLMYPYKMMPNPVGALRLTNHGCLVYFQKEQLETTVKVQTPFDLEQDPLRPEKRKPKLKRSPVWVVKVVIPRHLLNVYSMDKISSMADDSDDVNDVVDAYDMDIDDERLERNEEPGPEPAAEPRPEEEI